MSEQQKSKSRIVLDNILYAFSVQGASLLLSLLMSLVVPRILGVDEFSYWQLFLFYTSYVGFFHFGLNDGIYLRNGGIEYDKLNFSKISSQFWSSIVIQSFMGLAFAFYGVFFIADSKRQFVFVTTAICLVIVNAANFLGYVLQAANRVRSFSTSVLIDRAFFICAVVALLVFKEKHFEIFVVLYLASKFFCLLYCVILGKRIVFAKQCSIKEIFHEMGINISVGINLMLSNIASMLILGTGRLVVDNLWGLNAFGKFSFAISLANFFLLFIEQVSMVLFPALRQIDFEQQKQLYHTGRDFLGIVLSGIFLFYMPIKFILAKWLPQYSESLTYLALLLPMCTFDGKMSMLCTTYLKVLRKERVLLGINALSFVVSILLCLFSGFILKSIFAIVISMVIAVAFRSIVAELYLSKKMEIKVGVNIIAECFLAILFVCCTWFISPLFGFIIYFVVYAIYLYCNNKKCKQIYSIIKSHT